VTGNNSPFFAPMPHPWIMSSISVTIGAILIALQH
jgi:hypothetical protein